MSTQRETALENLDRFAYARDNGHLDFVAKATKCDDYFVGNQWDPKAAARLNRLGKPVLTINKILSTCAAVFGEQLASRADVSFRPARDGIPETAAALDKLWMHIAETNNLDWLESEVSADGFIRGRGFYDVRIDFDDQFMGEVRIAQLNSKNVVIDPDAEEYDPDKWKEVFLTKWLTLDDLDRLYGRSAAREVKGRPQSAFTNSYDTVDWEPDNFGSADRTWSVDEDEKRRRVYRIVERQYRELRYVECLVNPETGDLREIPETWDHNRIAHVSQTYGLMPYRKRLEKIRWTVSLDDMLLHHEWSPYRHFTPVPYFPFFRHGTTIGFVENLISPQDLLNKSVSQELHITNTTANSGWIVKNGALANMTQEELEERGGEDGLVVMVNGTTKDLEKISPNQVPSGIDRLSFKADEALKEVSMISDSMRGFDRSDVAAKAIQAKQARGSVSLSKPFDNLAYTRKLLARNVLDLVQSFYTETRIINVTGRNLTDDSESMVVNEVTPEGDIVNDLTLGEYAVVINTVPARESFEQTQFQEALELRQLGIAIPDDVLVEHSHLNRKTEIAQRIKELNGGGEPSQAEQQMQQLEMQLKELEAGEKEADIAVKQANAQLNAARAQKEMQPENDGQEAELVKLAMEREKMLAQIQLEQEKVRQQLELERQKAGLQAQLEREKMDQQLLLAREKASNDMQIASAKAESTMELASMQAETTRSVATEKAKTDQAIAKSKAQQKKEPK